MGNHPTSMKEQCTSSIVIDCKFSSDEGQVFNDACQMYKTHMLVMASWQK